MAANGWRHATGGKASPESGESAGIGVTRPRASGAGLASVAGLVASGLRAAAVAWALGAAVTAQAQPLPIGNQATTDRVHFYHVDALGSVRAVSDNAGVVVARYDYLPFGEEVPTNLNGRGSIPGYAGGGDATLPTRRRFTGQERDPESGLDYLAARYLSTAQGRFTTVDPANAGADLSDPRSWNAYTYGLNNPLMYVDPTGLDPTCTASGAEGNNIHCVDDWVTVRPKGGWEIGTAPPEMTSQGQAFARAMDENGEKIENTIFLLAGTSVAAGTGLGLAWAPASLTTVPAIYLTTIARVQVMAPAIAAAIAKGHSFGKHVLNRGEYPGWIRTTAQFKDHIVEVIRNPTAVRELSHGRIAFWYEPTRTVVVYNPAAVDKGTMFQATQGIEYFLKLK